MKRGVLVDGQGGLRLRRVWRAATPWSRLRGLIARPALQPGEGLVLTRCGSVHTCFMGDALDLVFLDKAGTIRRIAPHVKPWRLRGCLHARATLELAAGEAARLELRAGERLHWQAPPESARGPNRPGRQSTNT